MSELASISSICDVNPRLPANLRSQTELPVSFVPMSAVRESGSLEGVETRQLRDALKGYTYFEEGDVLVAKITPCMENGKVAQAIGLPHPVGFGSTEFHVLRPGPDVDGRYLFHMIWNPHFRHAAVGSMTGSAGQRRVPTSFFTRFRIPIPSLLEQRRIAAILDKADAVRRKRQQTLDLADQFLRSAFLDMFGDPVTNPKGWPVKKVREAFVTDRAPTKCGPFGSALRKDEYVEAGIPVLTMDNIVGDTFALEGCLFVTQGKREALAQYEVQEGDIIISRAGTVGKMCVVPELGTPAIISTNLIRLSLDPRVLEPTYFVALMNFCRGRAGSLRTGADGAYSFMNTGVLESLRLPFPPVHAQRDWLQLRPAVEQYKASMKHDGAVLAALASALARRAFRGEQASDDADSVLGAR